ncbi:hypothetical protein [Streptomyces sp. NPDC003688]
MKAVDNLKAIRSEELPALRREWQDALQQAAVPDARFTAEANQTRQKQAREQARAEALEKVDALAAKAEDLIGRVRRYADSRAPVAPSEALLNETRQARAWGRARALLDAGRSVQEVIKGADLDTLTALRTELPTYLAARQAKPQGLDASDWSEPDATPVLRLVDQAMILLLPAGTADRVQAGLDLAAIEPGLRIALEGLRAEIAQPEGGHGLRAAVAARFADRAATASV